MDLQTYIQRKKTRNTEEESRWAALRTLCPRCLRPESACFCRIIQPFNTRTRFIFLMHPLEARKEKNGTGRLAHLCLQNSEIRVGTDFSSDLILEALIHSPDRVPLLLYPGPQSTPLPSFPWKEKLADEKTPCIFLPDGTWALAKKIFARNPILQTLPRIALNPSQSSQFFIKRQPRLDCLSTIETVYQYLEECRRLGIETIQKEHALLLDVFRRMVNFQLACAEDPNREGYRRDSCPRPRTTRIKHHSRSPIIF
ncbi:MAG: DTW domain-containing protein [Acidobacteria bacterium]|nr:DTW domain-containing protein [Acidobacteriota bacterium]MBU4493866.1 DTW domain-containing protein [Acidobacteriota bacterium]